MIGVGEYEVELVIDASILRRMPETERFVSFLKFWITCNNTKAVVTLSVWKEFEKYWQEQLSERSEEITTPFFATMRGVATPYRNKYATEAGLTQDDPADSESIDEKTIVNRHYATVKYLIVENAEAYKSDGEIKITKGRILTLKEFFNRAEVENPELVAAFLRDFS